MGRKRAEPKPDDETKSKYFSDQDDAKSKSKSAADSRASVRKRKTKQVGTPLEEPSEQIKKNKLKKFSDVVERSDSKSGKSDSIKTAETSNAKKRKSPDITSVSATNKKQKLVGKDAKSSIEKVHSEQSEVKHEIVDVKLSKKANPQKNVRSKNKEQDQPKRNSVSVNKAKVTDGEKKKSTSCYKDSLKVKSVIPKTPQKRDSSTTPIAGAMVPVDKMAAGDMGSDDSDSESDWEEVEELPDQGDKSQIPDEPVQITLEDTSNPMKKKRKKKGFDMEEWFRLQMNRCRKESQLELHKVHLLCLLANGLRFTELCNDLELQAVGLSVVPSAFMQQKQRGWDIHLTKLTKWFHEDFTIDSELKEKPLELQPTLLSRFSSREVASEFEMVLLFVTLCRALGFDARLVYSLQPLTYKASDLKNKNSERKSKDPNEVISLDDDSKSGSSSKNSEISKTKTDKKTQASKNSASKKSEKSKQSKKSGQAQEDSKSRGQPKNRQHRKCASKVSYTEDDGNDQSNKKSRKKNTAEDDKDVIHLESSDDDFDPNTTNFRSPNHKSPVSSKPKSKHKIVSSDDSNDSVQIVKATVKESGHDYWAEVYVEAERKWICVDCVRARVNHPEEMGPRVTQPLCYALGFDNKYHVKDVTRRYASNYLSETRKIRIDTEWWDDSLQPYRPKTKADKDRDEAENLQLQAQLLKKPLPTGVSQYKNHPLYALKRHLLKYEALYPETAVPMGFIRGEPVYARECVQTLHSRENWLKEARLVRIGEEPYKVVKSKKRNSKMPGDEILMLNLFGRWQTEDYIPPPAYNGKVPRNEYGNVELFKPSMLPGGTVHLKLPGLNRVAKKLDIDCAAAMVGWDYHGGFSHPMMDGFIVCEEHKETLEAAWEEDQQIQREREAEKREKRVLANWKLLVKTLLIREKMKHRFKLNNLTEKKDAEASTSTEAGTKANDSQLSWPRNKQDDSKADKSKNKAHLFPFEVEEL